MNLFERIAEPIRITQTKTEYRVIPDQHRQLGTEVYSVDRVTSTATYMEEPRTTSRFMTCAMAARTTPAAILVHAPPAIVPQERKGTEVYLSLRGSGFQCRLFRRTKH